MKWNLKHFDDEEKDEEVKYLPVKIQTLVIESNLLDIDLYNKLIDVYKTK